MDSSNPANIQAQLLRLRRIILWGSGGALAAILAALAFVPFDERVLARGVVGAEHDTHLYAPADGVLAALEVREGDRVTAGQPVLRLDDTAWREQRRASEASLERARGELAREQAAMETTAGLPLPREFWHTQEEIGLARERIRHEHLQVGRAAELYDKGLVSRQDLERAQLALEVARSEESKALDRRRILEQGLEGHIMNEAVARIDAAYGALRELEVQRDHSLAAIERCVVRAPADGTVTLLAKRRPGVKVTRGEALAHLAHGEPVRVDIFCGESQYHRLRPGQRVLMRSNSFDALRHGYIEGTVERVAIEPESREDGEPRFRVVARIEHTPQPLVLGSTVEARIIIRRTPLWRLLLPHIEEA
jgi:multidrug resistance efflux pump